MKRICVTRTDLEAAVRDLVDAPQELRSLVEEFIVLVVGGVNRYEDADASDLAAVVVRMVEEHGNV